MNKKVILELCKQIKSSPKPEQAALARQLIAAANGLGDKLTDELTSEIIAALEPVNDIAASRANIITELNDTLRSEKDIERRRGILKAMIRVRNSMKADAQ